METEVTQQTGEKLLRILVFTLTLSVMGATMFNIVLPQISEAFDLTIAQVSWVISAYGLIYAIGTVTYGKLADTYKLKNLLTFGLLLFALGSLIGVASQEFWMMLVGRCIQAVGAAAIPATAMLISVRYFPPERRGSAIGGGRRFGSWRCPWPSYFCLNCQCCSLALVILCTSLTLNHTPLLP